MSNTIKSLGIGAIAAGVTYFLIWLFINPAMNFSATQTWLTVLVCAVIGFVSSRAVIDTGEITGGSVIFAFVALVSFVGLIIGLIIGAPLFNATKYQQRLDVKEKMTFEEAVDEFDINSIPRIDAEVSINLANRKLGELEEVVSQFEADEDHSTLINFNNKPYRVIPLKFASPAKYLANLDGIPGYIRVDLLSQKAEYVKFEGEKMKYAPSAMFTKDLNKRIKREYPSSILGEYSFEIDDDGTPFWVVSEITPNMGISGVQTVENVIVVNAITGDTEKYAISDVPQWIDRALDTEIVLDQIETWGKFGQGFWNSTVLFPQKGVKVPTKLYNYIIQNDDVYLYTGITSVQGNDHSNIGFFLVNMRTGEARFSTVPSSADESSAQASAQTIYQEKGYVATDPILVNVNGIPTYCTSLKDAASLVKVYAFVMATEHQTVGYASVQEGMEKALENYKKALNGESFTASDSDADNSNETKELVALETIDIEVEAIKEITFDGTTAYYIVSGDEVVVAPITANMRDIPNLEIGDKATCQAKKVNDYYVITSLELK